LSKRDPADDRKNKGINMIYTFRIISGEQDNFIREVEIDSHCLFLEFHEFLNSEMGFDKGELASFFITNQEWHKETEITLLNMLESPSPDIQPMSDTKLGELITEKKQRLLYVFDLFAERVLFLELIEIKDGLAGNPHCVRSEGDPPPAVLPQDFMDSNFDELEDLLNDTSELEDPFDEEDPEFIDYDEDLY
jgi:hypothetical protein